MTHTCPACHGTGYVTVVRKPIAKCGGTTYTDPRARTYNDRCLRCAEQQRIDADKAAFEATRPDYLQLAHDNIAAGRQPY